MKVIRFTRDVVFEKYGRNHADNPKFAKESEHTMRNDQAQRWLTRGAAELVEDLGGEEELALDDEEGRVAVAMSEARQRVEDALRGLGA